MFETHDKMWKTSEFKVNDTPLIIGDQLAILANFGLAIKELGKSILVT